MIQEMGVVEEAVDAERPLRFIVMRWEDEERRYCPQDAQDSGDAESQRRWWR